MTVSIKRIYDEPTANDGYRILVDRLWPRGVSKAEAALDLWLRDIAPSTELRTWFGHDPAKFTEFSVLYTNELEHNPAVAELRKIIADKPKITLLYGAKDPQVNHAIVLCDFLMK